MNGRLASIRRLRVGACAALLAACLAPLAVRAVAPGEKAPAADRAPRASAARTAAPRPNVLLLTVDTLRPDHLGCYGYPRPTSPNLDRLAGQSVVFSDAVSTSAWTSPGLISLLTGLYPSTHGVVNRESSLGPDVPSLPVLLAKAGYRVPNLTYLTSIPNYANLGFGPAEKEFFTGGKGEELLGWLSKAAPSSEPFFAWYHYRFVHLPYMPPPEVAARFLPEGVFFPPPSAQSTGLAAVQKEVIIPRASGANGTRFDLEADPPRVRALYDGEIFVMDEFLGEVLGRLKEKGLDGRTLIVVTADHGEELLDHGWVGHASTSLDASLYEELIRIPMIVRLPGGKHGGMKVGETVSAVDLMPTILDVLGLPIPEGVEGRSMMPLARRTQGWSKETAILETNLGGYQTPRDKLAVTIKAIRRDGWKLIQKKDGSKESWELYDLAADPGEKKNVAGSGRPEEQKLRVEFGNWILHHAGPGFFLEGDGPAAIEQKVPETVGCPKIASPADGGTLDYERDGGLVRARWTGTSDLAYLVEYDVGQGEFHVNGSFPLRGNVHEFGPYPQEVWKSLKSWNPWKVRVVLPGRSGCTSDWVTFNF